MTVPTDILGAIASNAGDEFHEIWALRAALSLLDTTSNLTALTVEGIASTAAASKEPRQWDGVDCGLYFGGDTIENAECINLVQLKYSVAAPHKNWTLGRLTKSTSSKGNNSVARRLGNAFKAAAKGKSNQFIENQITVSLVSIQPISPSLAKLMEKILQGSTSKDAIVLRAATGLSLPKFKLFCRCLNLKGGEAARSVLKSNVIQKIASVTDSDVSGTLADLRQTIRGRMLPESSSTPITRETVFTWFNVGDPRSLFPCEPKLKKTEAPIARKVVQDLADAVKSNPLVCLEGGGGCGKTTTAMMLETALPEGSQTVMFDCYGAGSYLDRSLPRHGPGEAFTQLSNDLAIQMRVPFLIPHKENPNITASFRRRLELASEILAEEAPDGLLVLIIDAANNAIFAANKSTLPEPCFVHDFVRISGLPDNVRFVVTTRSSGLDLLNLPPGCPRVVCGPFELSETVLFVRRTWPDATNEQIEQFHYLSNKVPFVQASTVSHAQGLNEALDFLRPNGKSLNDLFAAIFRDSSLKLGGEGVLDRFCGALSVLSTPTPTHILAELCGESEAFVREVCDDLSPHVRLTSKGFEFANEDFERFVRQLGESKIGALMDRAASLLLSLRHSSDYAAIHLFDVLVIADHQKELFDILEEEDSTRAITDKVVRRRTDLRRLKCAVSIAMANGDAVQAGKTVLIGAEAMRTDSKVSNLIHENIPLSTVFTETTVRQEILRVADQRALHGPTLMHLAKETALRPETLPLSREYVRMAVEWVNERSRIKDSDARRWEINDGDLIVMVYAVYKDQGWKGAIEFCWQWSPDPLPITLFTGLVELVLKRDGLEPIRNVRPDLSPEIRWISTIYLKRAGKAVSKKTLKEELNALGNGDLPELELGDRYQPEESRDSVIIDNLLFFTDICRHQSCPKKKIIKLIDIAWPKEQRSSRQTSIHQPSRIDFTLRAEMALSSLRNRPFSVKDAFQIKDDYKHDDNDFRRKSDTEFLDQIGEFEKYYRTTNDLISETEIVQIQDVLSAAASGLNSNAWRYENKYEFRMLQQVACRRIADIQAIKGLPVPEAVKVLKSMFPKYNPFGQRLFECFNFLLCHSDAFDPVADTLSEYAEAAITYNGPASERAEVLIDISKLLLPNSPDDAKVYFERATQVVEEMDVEAIDQIYFLTRASAKFPHNTPTSRAFCSEMAAIVEHAARVLEGEDHFPFEDAIDSMASLSVPVAMSALSQWTDTGLLYTEKFVRHFLETVVASGRFDPVITTAFLLFADETGLALASNIFAAAESLGKPEQAALLEELSVRSLLEIRPQNILNLRTELSHFASSHVLKSEAFDRLVALSEFLESNKADIQTKTNDTSKYDVQRSEGASEGEPTPDYSGVDPTDPAAILSAVEQSTSKTPYRDEDLFCALSASVKPSDRTKHLDALSALAQSEDWPVRYIEQIIARLDEWHGAAVQQWAASKLPQLVINLGGWLIRFGWYEPDYFTPLVEKTGLDGVGRVKLILKTIESNSEDLGSSALYRYAVELIQSLPDTEAEALFSWYLLRRKAAQQAGSSDVLNVKPIDLAKLPENIDECIPLFLYRYLGDVDARIRWRAAHSVRALVRMGRADVVSQLINCRDVGADFIFSPEDVPFHHLTAKLWLAISLTRVAHENPSLIAENAKSVLKIATDGPPHLLISMYIKRALSAAKETMKLDGVSAKNILALAAPVAGTVKFDNAYGKDSLGHHTSQDDLRFHFDSMDTLPYWYDSALKIFADVTSEEFLTLADHWIVDEWGADETSSHWDREPRQSRLSNEDFHLYHTGHGSYPAIERHSTYLEWHAMFVVASELIQSRKIAVYADDDYYGLGGWLQRWDTTYTDLWLADLRAPKPAGVKYWQPLPLQTDGWLEHINNDVFFEELTNGEPHEIVLYSSREIRERHYGSKKGSESVRVIGAFVPPDTAAGLLRAIQTTEDNWDYHLVAEPDDEHDHHPKTEGFMMNPAVRWPMAHRDLGFDDLDPVRVGMTSIRAAPADIILRELNIEKPESTLVEWSRTGSDMPVAQYRAWAELSDNTSDRELRHIVGQFSNGQILSINKTALLEVMKNIEMDLIFSVEIQRARGDKYNESKQEEAKESIFDRIYILRKDGSFEDIDGCIGSGVAPC